MSLEIEIKLLLDPSVVHRLPSWPPLKEVTPQIIRLENTYFDSSHWHLAAQKSVLRLRKKNEDYWQTFKRTLAHDSAIPVRQEWELPIDTPQLDLDLFPESAGLSAQKKTLEAKYLTTFERQQWPFHYQGSLIELALDQGQVNVCSNQVDQPQTHAPILEVELELQQGDPLALLAAALELSRFLPVIPSILSKSAIGQYLHPQAPKLAIATPQSNLTDMSVEEAFIQLCETDIRRINTALPLFSVTGQWSYLVQVEQALTSLRHWMTHFARLMKIEEPIYVINETVQWLCDQVQPQVYWWQTYQSFSDHLPNIFCSDTRPEAAHTQATKVMARLKQNTELGCRLLTLMDWMMRRHWQAYQTPEQKRLAQLPIKPEVMRYVDTLCYREEGD